MDQNNILLKINVKKKKVASSPASSPASSEYNSCYKNSKILLKEIFENKPLKIIGLQEFRFNDPNTKGLEESLKKSFPRHEDEIISTETELTNTKYINKISYLQIKAKKLDLFNFIKNDKFEAIVGGIEKVESLSRNPIFYEGISLIIDTETTGNVEKILMFNLSKNLPADQSDIRPALIVVTSKFLIINIHAPWPKGLYELNFPGSDQDKERFDKENNDHLTIAGKNLKQAIINELNTIDISMGSRDFIFLGDFNDTTGAYPNLDWTLPTDDPKKINWCDQLNTCCYSHLGMNLGDKTYKAKGDYIASSLNISSTQIPYLELNTNKLSFDNKYKDSETIPMSDHTPILVNVQAVTGGKGTKKYKDRTKKKNKLPKKRTNKKKIYLRS